MNLISQIWHGSHHETVQRRRAGCTDEQGRWGLTLIEILIATTLMAALLVALWRLVGIYTSLRDKGESHAGRVGNVSVMMQQLEEDLRNLPDVRPEAARFGEATTRNEVETAPVDNEVDAFNEAYDDEPAVETLSESAIELEGSSPHSHAISQDEDLALSEIDSFDSDENPANANFDMGNFDAGQPARGQAQAGLTRSGVDRQSIAGEPAAASCLIGDEQSLTLANLDCQVSRKMGEAPGGLSHNLHAESGILQDPPDYELSKPSGFESPTNQYASGQPASGESVTVQKPVRFVRYWLASVMPLMAQATAEEQDRVDAEGIGHSISANGAAAEIGTTGSMGTGSLGTSGAARDRDSEERVSGLYREEVVGVSTPVQMGSLRGRSSLENLPYGSLSERSNLSGTSGLDNLEETENSEEVIRRSFHLAQVEWAKFRYFDGSQWTSAWDSRVQGELPVAIEMSLWLLRLNAKRTAGQVASEKSPASATEMTWTEIETMSEANSQFPMARQEPQAGNAELSSLADDNPMERQPEVRQLVVLRTAPHSGDRLRGAGYQEDGQPWDTIPDTNSNLLPPSSDHTLQRTVRPMRP